MISPTVVGFSVARLTVLLTPCELVILKAPLETPWPPLYEVRSVAALDILAIQIA